MAVSVPSTKVTSPEVPFQVKVLPGSSLKVKVIFAVSPDFKVATSELMLMLGAAGVLCWVGDAGGCWVGDAR
jgi:hypothetical protein